MAEEYYYFLFNKNYSNQEKFELTVEAIVDEETEYTGRYRATIKSQDTQELSSTILIWDENGNWSEAEGGKTLLAERLGKEIENFVE